jgi:hypothetical protein
MVKNFRLGPHFRLCVDRCDDAVEADLMDMHLSKVAYVTGGSLAAWVLQEHLAENITFYPVYSPKFEELVIRVFVLGVESCNLKVHGQRLATLELEITESLMQAL